MRVFILILWGLGLRLSAQNLGEWRPDLGADYLLDVKFYYNKWDILPSSFGRLDSVAAFLGANDKLEVEIYYYWHQPSGPPYSSKKEVERAKSVCKYLIMKGISADRLRHRGERGVQKKSELRLKIVGLGE